MYQASTKQGRGEGAPGEGDVNGQWGGETKGYVKPEAGDGKAFFFVDYDGGHVSL